MSLGFPSCGARDAAVGLAIVLMLAGATLYEFRRFGADVLVA